MYPLPVPVSAFAPTAHTVEEGRCNNGIIKNVVFSLKSPTNSEAPPSPQPPLRSLVASPASCCCCQARRTDRVNNAPADYLRPRRWWKTDWTGVAGMPLHSPRVKNQGINKLTQSANCQLTVAPIGRLWFFCFILQFYNPSSSVNQCSKEPLCRISDYTMNSPRRALHTLFRQMSVINAWPSSEYHPLRSSPNNQQLECDFFSHF